MNKNVVRSVWSFTSSRRNYCYKFVRRPNVAPVARKQPAPAPEIRDSNAIAGLAKQIEARILSCGPITVADYMREVLTNPTGGYYMQRDVFGEKGDFITSPEISQIFGELIGVWVYLEWRKLGNVMPFQLVELGPGRGTLMRDVLRVLSRFRISNEFSVHMVEISPHLSNLQVQRFCYKHDLIEDPNSPYYLKGETAAGTKAYWYKRLEDVPKMFSVYLAHEFFDALPVHKLQLDNGIWKEILIDVNKSAEKNSPEFRYVISKSQTPVSKLYQPMENETRKCLEYSPEVDRIIGLMSERIAQDGGIGLLMDYGHYGEKSDTFRGFKKHQLHDPLVEPGTADITADVDFKQVQKVAESNGDVICFGPVEQGAFLKKMEGDARLEQLLQKATPENQPQIKSGYEMLTHPDKMGKRFKFFSMFPAVLEDHLKKFPVHGFF